MGATNVNPNINVNLGQAPNGLQTEQSMVLNAPNQDVGRIAFSELSVQDEKGLCDADTGNSCLMVRMLLDSTPVCWRVYLSVNSTGQSGMYVLGPFPLLLVLWAWMYGVDGRLTSQTYFEQIDKMQPNVGGGGQQGFQP
jgi:hypothetical protein